MGRSRRSKFDFLTDTQEKKDPYLRDKYAHELYATPNYDGILVSKIVLDKSAKKDSRLKRQEEFINFFGLRKHIILRMEKLASAFCDNQSWVTAVLSATSKRTAPYRTNEILEYYEQFGFTYGVSIDHLIVGPFAKPGIREQRYELTLKNAEDFIRKHQARGHAFTPIGVAQGGTQNPMLRQSKISSEWNTNILRLAV